MLLGLSALRSPRSSAPVVQGPLSGSEFGACTCLDRDSGSASWVPNWGTTPKRREQAPYATSQHRLTAEQEFWLIFPYAWIKKQAGIPSSGYFLGAARHHVYLSSYHSLIKWQGI